MVSAKVARRMAQNEMVFREYNERIQKGFDELSRLAKQEGKGELSYEDNAPLHFNCECSDESCSARITLTPSAYAHIHEQRKRFVVKKGHDVVAIERIIHKSTRYNVVETRYQLPKRVSALQSTEVDGDAVSG